MVILNSPFIHPFIGLDLAVLLDTRARQRGAHPLIIWSPFDAPAETWSYARFADEAARIAGGLAARGVKPGDRVLVHLENCPEALLALFACARLGAICVPTNAMASGLELAWFAKLTGARCAITQPRFASLVEQNCPALEWIAVTATDASTLPDDAKRAERSLAFATLRAEPSPVRAPDPNLPSLIMFTTGTTSRSKGVLWTHANALWSAKLGVMQQAVRPDDVYQVFLPLFHVIGLAWSFLPALWAGATVLLQPRFSTRRYWPAAIAHHATIGSHVIFTSRMLSQQPVPKHTFRQWSNGLFQPALETTFGLRILSAYGMTELISQGIIGDLSTPQRAGSMGRPSTGYQLRIVDDGNRPIAAGGTGHLLIRGVRGVSLFAEYFSDPKATSDAFDEDGYFRTGDRVTVHDDGCIEFLERAKDMLKVGGESVSAAEVEAIVRAVAGVKAVAVVARPDRTYGEVAVAYVLLEREAKESVIERILAHCRSSLAKFKVPRDVVVLDEFPLIGNGKISKVRLREMARELATESALQSTDSRRD